MTDLQRGGNAPVPAPASVLTVTLAWPQAGGVAVDVSAFLLDAASRVRGDSDMVFYNQPEGAGGAVRFASSAGEGRFTIDPAALPNDIERVVFCVTCDTARARGQTLARIDGAEITVAALGTVAALRFRPALADASEAAMVFGELYRRAGQWKFRAVGQGFDGGLAPLARSFGIDVADAVPPVAPVPPAPRATVSLAKVTLEKRGQTVSLEKRGSSFGEITVNLNWSRGRRGLFGGGAIDLDLGCLFELADGRKGAVQAVGRAFGSFAQAPFVALSGDDRTGDVSQGETLRINGAHWPEIRRVAVFATIYAGVPNWQQTDGVVLVTMPDQPPIELRLTAGRNDHRLCGVVLIENDGGRVRLTRIVDYMRDQRMLDETLGWGLQWVHGRKD